MNLLQTSNQLHSRLISFNVQLLNTDLKSPNWGLGATNKCVFNLFLYIFWCKSSAEALEMIKSPNNHPALCPGTYQEFVVLLLKISFFFVSLAREFKQLFYFDWFIEKSQNMAAGKRQNPKPFIKYPKYEKWWTKNQILFPDFFSNELKSSKSVLDAIKMLKV